MNDLPRRPPAGVGARGLLDRPRELLSKLKPITSFALNLKKCDFKRCLVRSAKSEWLRSLMSDAEVMHKS
jgi:hypothetical protein